MNELIPQAERRVLSDKALAELRSQLDLLLAERAKVAPAKGQPAPAARTQAEIEVETRQFREELDQVQRQRADLRLQVEETWRRHHVEHPEKLAELERIAAALDRVRRFQQAVQIARETIQQVAQETHRRWADYLNRRVSEILSSMGTRITELRFGEDLDFTLQFENGQPTERSRALLELSTGSRDQLYLAIRLAISEFLSRGVVPVPLLVDDAFATSDDERARVGMRLLLEHVSRQHQVIFVTCHRQRCMSFAEREPELYSQRVHWLNANAVGVKS
jgi:uncharacterized protein YhaN